MADAAMGARTNTGESYGSSSYRSYVLLSLLIVYTFNFVDRTLINVLNEPIREAFGFSDTVMGLLSGVAFSFLYSILGVPIAMLAERINRVYIMAACMVIWSVMTMVCGIAGWMGAAIVFLIGRIGVGIGEAGCSPPAHALISDYFKEDRRASALSVYSVGIPLGSLISGVAGAFIAQQVSWEWAFVALGAIGVPVALVFALTVKDPPRGYSDPPGKPKLESPPLFEVFKVLSKKKAFWLNSFGGASAALAGYGVGQFTTAYFMRIHEFDLQTAALLNSVLLGIGAGIGAWLSGNLADRVSHRYPNALPLLSALGFVICVPLFLIGWNSPAYVPPGTAMAMYISMPILFGAAVTHYFYLGPQFAINQSLLEPKMRATGAALFLLIVNIIGYSLGPPIVGWFSDTFANMHLANAGSEYTKAMCQVGGDGVLSKKALGELIEIGTANVQQMSDYELCKQADANGLRYAVSVGQVFYALAGVIYFTLSFFWQQDKYVPEQEGAA